MMIPASIGAAMWAFVLTYAPPLLAYLVLRTLTVHLVLRWMMKRAPGPIEPEPAVNLALPAPRQANLHFLELDSAKGVLLSDSYEDRVKRALGTGAQTLGIFWKSFLAFIVTAAILLYLFVQRTASPADSTAMIDGSASPVDLGALAWTGSGILICVAAGFGLLATFGTATTRYRSLGRVSLWSCTSGVLLQAVLSVAVGRLLGMRWYLYTLPPISAALVVAAGFAGIARAARADGNITLLILRVFGADANTAFVFGPLMRGWRFLGSFFTIVDPSYVRYQFSLSSSEMRWKLLRVVGAIGVLVAALSWIQYGLVTMLPFAHPALTAWADIDGRDQQRLLGIVVWILLIPLSMVPVIWTVRSRFVRSGEQLVRRIERGARRPAGFSGLFSALPLYCYDNVWKKAVQSLLVSADAVLMDLRGFSAERRGCEYEIGLLLDRYPIQQMVFLVDGGNAKEAVYDTLRRVWGGLTSTSPNRGVESPILKMYVPRGNEAHDTSRILALLAASAVTTGGGGSLVRFDEPAARRHIDPLPTRFWKWNTLGLHLGEAIDTAIATPKYARVLIPLMTLAVAAMFYLSLRPALEGYATYRNVVTAALSAPESADAAADQSDALPPTMPTFSPTPEPPSDAALPATRSAALRATAAAFIQDGVLMTNDKTYARPLLVLLDLTGGLAADAVRYGHVTLEPALTDADVAMEPLRVAGASGSDLGRELVAVNRNERHFSSHELMQPKDGLKLTITYARPETRFTQIKRITGTAVLQAIDPDQTVTLENVGARAADSGIIKLQHARLDEIGQFTLDLRDAEHPELAVSGRNLSDLGARLVDAAGRISIGKTGGGFTANGTTTMGFTFTMETTSLPTARLEIVLGYKSFTAPFTVTDVMVEK
jgi:hypothetical protein